MTVETSGNVSLYNAPNGRSIKPTPTLVMVGVGDKKNYD